MVRLTLFSPAHGPWARRTWPLWLTATVLQAADPGIAFFESKVRPVLAEHCYECHSEQAKRVRGSLLLDSKSGWQNGGASGEPALIPGNPEDSLLIRSIRHVDEDLTMPPKKPKLPDAVIADLIQWVKMGAPDPRDGVMVEAKRADKSWWSLQPLAHPEPPSPTTLSAAWRKSPIDRFIYARLAEQGLAPNPPAGPRELIRRMTYDLTGLPPTPTEVEAFIIAHRRDSPRATASLVDRLLASPHYGEQYGRHWLDVTRFGESNGFERNVLINELWPFRDYVIQSLNDDKPFNRFIVEHLAGDVIGKDDPAVAVGSAFLVAGPYDDVGNQDKVAQANIRAATLDDIINATSGAFLGLTVSCARCHDHKFDPIPTEDYYRLRSAFEGVTHGRRVIATSDERQRFQEATEPLKQELTRLDAELGVLNQAIDARALAMVEGMTFKRPKVDIATNEERFEPVEARFVRFVMHAQTGNAKTAVGARLDEFEIWTAGPDPRNVALAQSGAKAEGARASVAEDFPDAYGPQFAIDGNHAEQWFIGAPAQLTLTLARTETVERIVFHNQHGAAQRVRTGQTPCEYDVQVSLDGTEWRTVATSADREPWTPEHAVARLRRDVITPAEQMELSALTRQKQQTQRQLNAVPPLRLVWAGTYAEPTQRTFVHKGGDPMKPADPVAPASLAVLDRVTTPYQLDLEAPEAERRLALARWIASDENPLTARVLANRVWHYHFGIGIVDTPSDFGFLGGRPTHPELLDWLAARLQHHGWRLKPLHREILLSQTYQQSGAYREEAARADQSSRFLWRFPPRRLGAEEIRDTMLQVAGKLESTMGGPGFRLYKFTQNNVSTYFPLDQPGPETYRRAVYHQNARASIVDLLSDFDFPDIAAAAPRRAHTTTPLQALTLLNHRFTLDMAAALAARLSGDAAGQVQQAYALAFQRAPSSREAAGAVTFIQAHGIDAFCRALLNTNELIHLE